MKNMLITLVAVVPDEATEEDVEVDVESRMEIPNPKFLRHPIQSFRAITVNKADEFGYIAPLEVDADIECPACEQLLPLKENE